MQVHVVSGHLTKNIQRCAKCKPSNFSPQVRWKYEPAVLGENLLNMTNVFIITLCRCSQESQTNYRSSKGQACSVTIDPPRLQVVVVVFQARLEEKRFLARQHKLQFLAMINERRCMAQPIYGQDLVHSVTIFRNPLEQTWCKVGHRTPAVCETLQTMTKTPQQRVDELKETIKR